MIRLADTRDAEIIADVAAQAFGFPRGGERWQQLRREAEAHPGDHLVVEQDGCIVGALHLVPQRMWVDGAEVLECDVHNVAVVPERQGRGLGTELMEAAVNEMNRRGVAFSRLGGLARFYSRFGYCPFPRGMYEFPVEPVEGGARVLTPEEGFGLPAEVRPCVRRYNPRTDWKTCGRLWQQMYAGRTGAPVRHFDEAADPPQAGPDPHGLDFVYDDGQVRGYACATILREGRVFRPCDGRVAVTEAAFEPDRPEALWAPLRRILLEAVRMNAWRVVARLPFDAVVERALIAGEIPFRRVEFAGGPACNMVRVVNLYVLTSSLRPVLERRARDASVTLSRPLTLEVAGQAVILRTDPAGSLHVESVLATGSTAAEGSAVLDSAAMMALVLGLRTWPEISASCLHNLTPEQTRALVHLFPPQPTATGLWG
ncbi:MAG: GNAT family N-acetyltransferase [Armatimonadetes bacterium]|nr:GNAT family N-acetyltransferase [Armatimonadota bacterium]